MYGGVLLLKGRATSSSTEVRVLTPVCFDLMVTAQLSPFLRLYRR